MNNDRILQILNGAQGRLLALITGIFVGLVVRALTAAGFQISPEALNDITYFSGIAATLLIEWLVIYLSAQGVREIQKALPPEVKVDGVPGEKTLEAVKEAVAVHNEVQNTPP